jgi:hypothetical protein
MLGYDQFGMGNTLLTLVDKYYEYGGDMDVEDRGLTIGGYSVRRAVAVFDSVIVISTQFYHFVQLSHFDIKS